MEGNMFMIERKLTSPLRSQIERIFNEKKDNSPFVASVDKDKPRKNQQNPNAEQQQKDAEMPEREGKLDLIA
jgi:hypothetical protein